MMGWLFGLFAGLPAFALPVGVILLILLLRQRKGQEYDIPPLDLIDAKKLDDRVARKVRSALKPLLQSQGYDEAQSRSILTRNASGRKEE